MESPLFPQCAAPRLVRAGDVNGDDVLIASVPRRASPLTRPSQRIRFSWTATQADRCSASSQITAVRRIARRTA